MKGLFEGEVFSRSFSPLLGLGCLSPRTVAHALREKDAQRPFFQPKDPEVARIEEVSPHCFCDLAARCCAMARRVGGWVRCVSMSPADLLIPCLPHDDDVQVLEQKEWHTLLAEQDLSSAPVPEPMEFGYWKWHGYLVRYARTRRVEEEEEKKKKPTDDSDDQQQQNKKTSRRTPPRPSLLLVHGFGASCDQWSKCFTQLAQDYDVWALDLLGFGHSVKEPITYTQYLWQDQVRHVHTTHLIIIVTRASTEGCGLRETGGARSHHVFPSAYSFAPG